MGRVQSIPNPISGQIPYQDQAKVLDSIDDSRIVRKMAQYRANGGPRTYSIRAMFRAYLLMYLLNMASVSELWRKLDDDSVFRLLCGFSKLPHRTTFDRFIARLRQHKNLVDEVQIQITDKLRALHPDMGQHIAVDSTTVRTHSNAMRVSKITGQVSDPEASKTAKVNNRSGKMDWWFGYKLHLMVDAKYQIPITAFTTTAKRHDSPTLPELMERAKFQFRY